MKKIYYMLLAMLAMSFVFTACNDKEPFSTTTVDDEPRILNPVFPDRSKDGSLPVVAKISRDANLAINLTVTPTNFTSVSWLIDGHEVEIGTKLDISLKAGTYRLKIIASTDAGKSTYREGVVQVSPLPSDPWATEMGFERIIVPGKKALFYGDNLNKVQRIIIDGKTITGITYIEDEGGNYIEYTVPADLINGEYRVIFVDAGGTEYGGNNVNVTSSALITSGANRTNSGKEWVITGVNIDQIASLTFAGQTINEFTQQTATEIAFICPDLEDGEYSLSGKTKNGKDVQFYSTTGNIFQQTVIVSSEFILWEGHHYVSWDLPDDSPNKVFNLIGKDVFASMKAGATLSIHYSVAPEAEYHKLELRTASWTVLPGTSAIEFSEDGVTEVQLTQAMLDLIQEQNGFICVGHGYYVDLVTEK